MCVTDDFGNTRVLPIAFALIFAALSLGVVSTSQTLWDVPLAPTVPAAH